MVYEVNIFIAEGSEEEAKEMLGAWFDFAQYYCTNNLGGHDTRYDADIDLFVDGFQE